jgi:hypothetical protein
LTVLQALDATSDGVPVVTAVAGGLQRPDDVLPPSVLGIELGGELHDGRGNERQRPPTGAARPRGSCEPRRSPRPLPAGPSTRRVMNALEPFHDGNP